MRPIILALIAALLFGLSTPAAKILLDTTDPWLLAGLFYLGSGLGLGGLRVILLLIGRAPRDAPLRRRDVPWLTGAILTGGIVGPVFLMFGRAGVARVPGARRRPDRPRHGAHHGWRTGPGLAARSR